MTCHYSVFGLEVEANLPVRDFGEPRPSFAEPDIIIRIAVEKTAVDPNHVSPWFTSSHRAPSGEPTFLIFRDDLLYRFHYPDGARFTVTKDGREIVATCEKQSDFDDLLTYLTGPVLGFAMRLQGLTVLHASAVTLDGRAVLFIGSPGAGKSTLAAALASEQGRLLSDNLTPLFPEGAGFSARPGYPRIRLWPASEPLLFGKKVDLPRLSATWDKRFIEASGILDDRPRPLDRIYALEWRETPEVVFEELSGTEGALTLIANSYPEQFREGWMQESELAVIGKLMQTVRLFTLARGESSGIADVRQAVVDHAGRRHFA